MSDWLKAGGRTTIRIGVSEGCTGDDFEATPIKPLATATKEAGKYRKGG